MDAESVGCTAGVQGCVFFKVPLDIATEIT